VSKGDSYIRIRGARVHNLKDIDVDIPKNKLVVITGLSGSGKSSLAFDTIYAEAERRFVESLSSYARQFLGIKEKPDVESISGLSPAIAIDQKTVSRNPRSTVGTITEIYDYLRILFARAGEPHCPRCGKLVGKQSVEGIIKQILKLETGAKIIILAPVVQSKKGEHRSVLSDIRRQGFLRARIDGGIIMMDDAEGLALDAKKTHTIEIVVDKIVIDKSIDRPRLRESLETALKIGKGLVIVSVSASKNSLSLPAVKKKSYSAGAHSHLEFLSDETETEQEILFSEHLACSDCGVSIPEIEPRLFSFNSPYGACSYCTGIGNTLEVVPELVLPNQNLTIAEGAIRPWAAVPQQPEKKSWHWWTLADLAERHKFSLNTPVSKLPKNIIDFILYGEKQELGHPMSKWTSDVQKEGFEGVIPNLKRRWKETDSDWTRQELERYMRIEICPACDGKRLRSEALGITFYGRNIADIAALSAISAFELFKDILLKESKGKLKVLIGLFREIIGRLDFLCQVGLEYLTLDRSSTTLAGGEAQRVRLATQISSSLTGVIYVLDEPSIGLHPRDHARLLSMLKELRDLGNTVLVVEHDAETMREADWILDIGPGAGAHGGNVVFSGTPKEILKAKTLTGEYLSGIKKVFVQAPPARDENSRGGRAIRNKSLPLANGVKEFSELAGGALIIKGASEHNLKNIDVKIPLGKLVVVSGVSGSGKSSLVDDILARALLKHFYGAKDEPGKHKNIEGIKHIDKVVLADQSPIGRTPRSNPATYTGVFTFIRELFVETMEAHSRGYKEGRFSFNIKGGRCEACEGQGVKKIEMYFLPDIYAECDECGGKRYSRETLEILYQNKTIADILDMSIEDAYKFFKNVPSIEQRLKTLVEVGLGYMKLGQSATTLSGGEAQRIKLAFELSKKDRSGKALYILDEPTTGLHFEDIQKLLTILRALTDKGNSIIIIEHNLDIICNADWIIDMGPEGGSGGGEIIAEGTPDDIAKVKNSYTGILIN